MRTWEDIIKAKTTKALGENTNSEAYFSYEDMDNMKEDLSNEITDVMASILNEYDVGASNDSFHMPTVNEGLKKIFEAMTDYIEGSDMTIQGKSEKNPKKKGDKK